VISNPLTDYLAKDGDDSEAEGRLKNVLEGVIAGGFSDVALGTFKRVKMLIKAKRTGDEKTLKETWKQVSDELEKLAWSKSSPPKEGALKPTDGNDSLSIGSRVKDPKSGVWGDVIDLDASREVARVAFRDADGIKEIKDIGYGQIDKDAFEHVNKELTDTTIEAGVTHDPVNIGDFKGMKDDELKEIVNRMFDENVNFFELPLKNKTFSQFESGDNVAQLADQLMTEAAERGLIDITPQKMQTLVEKGVKINENLGGDPSTIMAAASESSEELTRIMGRYHMLNSLVEDIGVRVVDMARKVHYGIADDIVKADLIHHTKLWFEAAARLKHFSMSWGRSFNALKTKNVPVSGLSLDDLRETIAMAGQNDIKKFAKELLEIDNPAGMYKYLEQRSKVGFTDKFNEVFINGILSGPKTHIVNTLSNALKAITLPAEQMIGGIRTGDWQSIREAKDIFTGFYCYLFDSIKYAAKSFKSDRAFLDVGKGTAEQYGRAFDGKIGTAINLPVRALTAVDEGFKQLAYRSHLRAKMITKGRQRYDSLVAKGTSPASSKQDFIAQFVSDQMEKAFDGTGKALDKASLQYAREATWTTPLEGKFGKWLQDGARKIPILKQVVPFVRTPTNIINDAWRHTPIIGKHTKQMQFELDITKHGDSARVARARGKMMVGKMVWTAAAAAAMSGRITGGGPRDYAQRGIKMETGWQPYSFKVGDKYISYQRIEPWGTILGLAADFADAMRNGPNEVGEDFATEFAGAMVASVANNITSKTYLKGLLDTASVLNEPEQNVYSWIKQAAPAHLPYSSFLGQTRQMVDPTLREARTLWDKVLNKVPGLSEHLPPKYSWITGQPQYQAGGAGFVPITTTEDKGNAVLDELTRLEHSFQGPPRKVGNVELTTDQYAMLKKLVGTEKVGNKTLQERLYETINDPYYHSLQDSLGDYEGGKVYHLKQVISVYNQKALNKLKQLDKVLGSAILEDRKTKSLRKRPTQ
jgi:hypothetical protein